ncbi:putative quinol monooxygenase [Niveispirillum sp. KHB5.9]|uniref:putative quinol monooxygenase n=1 Tax=Niveispirillum sp. KHB5.9 TaxID=3400269 RepID=UPI003A87A5AF
MPTDAFAVWATMEARPGREEAVRAFLTEAARRLRTEPGTTSFRAMDLGEGRFAIFNTFVDEAAFKTHVGGEVARWVQDSREELFTDPYAITLCRTFAAKGDVA